MQGELWFFNSNFSLGPNLKQFESGHIGISFDRNKFDKDKEIFGFGPAFPKIDTEGSVKGIVTNDYNFFNDFLTNCASNDNPLYKLDIIFDPNKVNKFFNDKSTYSNPLIAEKNFIEFFDKYDDYNNCLTYLISRLDLYIETNSGDKKISLKNKYSKYVGWIPGGYISMFIYELKKYSQIYTKKITL